MKEADVYESTLQLSNPARPAQRVLLSAVVYAADYYPHLNLWVAELLSHPKVLKEGLPDLLEVLRMLSEDLSREVIYGPCGSYVATYDRPHQDHLNEKFIR